VQVRTFADYASELAGHPGITALSGAQRWLLFFKALRDSTFPGQWKMLARSDPGARGLYQLFDYLRANSIQNSDIKSLEKKYPVAQLFTILFESYGQNIANRNAADLTNLIQKAITRIKAGSAGLSGLYIFDLMHEARPDEFEFAVAIAQASAGCLFTCDPSAPPPAGRPVVKTVASELTRRFPSLESTPTGSSPGEEIGRKIVEGLPASVGEPASVLQFNDLASEFRGLAQLAKSFMSKEGILAEDIAFYIAGNDQHAQLMQYELERAGVLQDAGLSGFRASNPLEREVRLMLGLLAEPDRPDLRLKAVTSGMAENKPELEKKLAGLSAKKDSASLDELFYNAVDILLPELAELEKEALKVYRDAATDFTVLAGTGRADADLPGLISSLGGYLQEAARESCCSPLSFLDSARPALREYAVVFLPSLNSATEPEWQRIPGFNKFAEALIRKLGKPASLPTFPSDSRKRWELGTAATAGARVVLSCHRQENGRRVEPIPWLKTVPAITQARPPVEVRRDAVTHPPEHGANVTISKFLSASAISDYIACPHLFYMRRLLKLKSPESEHMSLGLLLHNVLAEFHRPGETDFSNSKIQQLLEKAVTENRLATESLDRARMLLEAYVSEQAFCAEETIDTEHKFQLKLGGATILGRIDRIVSVPGGVKLIDYKTSGSGKEIKHKNAVVERLEDIQLPLYTHAALEMGHPVRAFSYIYLDYEKTNRPHELTLRFSEERCKDAISEVELRESVERINSLVEQILSGKVEYAKGESAPCRIRSHRCNYSAMCSFAGE
jgi:RecB family exonuclease